MSGIVESVGSIGLNNHRSDRRSVYTLEGELTPWEIWRAAVRLRRGAEINGNDRAMLKFLGRLEDVPPSARHLVDAVFAPTVASSEYPTQSGVIFMSANAEGRRDTTLQAQWDAARRILREPLRITPRERLQELWEKGYAPDNTFTEEDDERLSQIWGPFGWDLDGVKQFRKLYNPLDPSKAGYFACIRDQRRRMVSAAKAEILRFAHLNQVEVSEVATLQELLQNGLGSAVAILAVEEVAKNLPDGPTVVMGEGHLSGDNPGYLALRNAGFTPAGADLNSPVPNGVLQAHVSIYGRLASFMPAQITPEHWDEHYS